MRHLLALRMKNSSKCWHAEASIYTDVCLLYQKCTTDSNITSKALECYWSKAYHSFSRLFYKLFLSSNALYYMRNKHYCILSISRYCSASVLWLFLDIKVLFLNPHFPILFESDFNYFIFVSTLKVCFTNDMNCLYFITNKSPSFTFKMILHPFHKP